MSQYSGNPSDPNTAGPLDHQTAVSLIERADALVAQGDYQAAGALYQRVIGHGSPDVHVAALLGLGECYYRLDHDDAAMQAWVTATQAPETPLTWVAWRQIAAARVRAGNLDGARTAYREADRRAPPQARAEISSRLGWISKELGDRRAAGRYFGRARGSGDQPLVTYAIMAVTIAISGYILLDTMTGGGLPAAVDLFNGLGLSKVRVSNGELWRLITVTLVHDPQNPLHLAFNMYALFLVGPTVERMYGRVQYLAIYLLSAIGGSIGSLIFIREDSVGASGAIFGLFGVLFIAYQLHHPLLGRQGAAIASQVGFLIIVNLALGFGLMGAGIGIDNFAHVGGLITGGWLGIVLAPGGALTLARMWQRPEGGGRLATDERSGAALLRGAGLLALGVVLVVGYEIGAQQYQGANVSGSSVGEVPAVARAADTPIPAAAGTVGIVLPAD